VSFDTGYVGAHRWHVEQVGSYKWVCTCGDRGSIASTNTHFVIECFARHAHEKLQEAAVALLADSLEPTPTQAQIGDLREQGETDKANLLQLFANHRYHDD
jgi:hypothetical protein